MCVCLAQVTGLRQNLCEKKFYVTRNIIVSTEKMFSGFCEIHQIEKLSFSGVSRCGAFSVESVISCS